MALTVPQSRGVLPEQNAPQNLDPSRQFGNQIANPINLPDVLQGQGGYQVDQSGQIAAINQLGSSVSGAVQQMADDHLAKEAALRKANEHLDLVESQAKLKSTLVEKQNTIHKLLLDGFYDAEGAKEQYKREVEGATDQFLAIDKYKTPEITQALKLSRVGLTDNAMTDFSKNVTAPYQTAKYTERIHGSTSSLIDGVATTAQHQGYDQTVDVWKKTRQDLIDLWSSPETVLLYGPEKAQQMLEKSLTELAQAPARGMQARDYVPRNGEKYDVIKGAQIKLNSYQLAKDFYSQNPQIRQDAGQSNELIQAGLERKMAEQMQIIQREEESRARKAEAAAKRAQDERTMAMLRDLAKNGNASPFVNPDNIRGVDAAGMEKVLSAGRSAQERGYTVDQKIGNYDMSVRAGVKYTNPSKDEIEQADFHWQRVKQSADFQKLSPADKDGYLLSHYIEHGVMPTEIREATKRGLISADPQVVQATVSRIRSFEQANPTVVNTVYKPEELGLYNNLKNGVPPEKARVFYDKAKTLTDDDKTANADRLRNQANVKKDWEVTDLNHKALEKEWTFWFSKDAKPSKELLDEADKLTRNYFNYTGDYKTAQKMAIEAIKTRSGVSEVNGNKVVMRYSPEKLTGAPVEKLDKQFASAVADVKKINPELASTPLENFIIVEDVTTSSKNKQWQVMRRDEDGMVFPIPHPQTLKPYAYFQYDNKADIEEINRINEKKYEEARKHAAEVLKQDREKANREAAFNMGGKTRDAVLGVNNEPSTIGTSWNNMQGFKPKNAR